MIWAATLAIVAVAVAGVIYRGATTSDGLSFRLLQLVYFSFNSLNDFQRRGGARLDLADLVAREAEPAVARFIRRVAPSQSGWFAARFPTDKSGWHDYLRIYDAIFACYRNEPGVSMLEIGVKKGGSIALWREYFDAEAMIYGIDVNPLVPMFRRDGHVKILVLDSRDAGAVTAALEGIAFDIILDDGLHEPEAQWQSFCNLRHRLKPGGVYILEDVYQLETERYSALGYTCHVIPDPSGQYLQVILPPASRAAALDWPALSRAG